MAIACTAALAQIRGALPEDEGAELSVPVRFCSPALRFSIAARNAQWTMAKLSVTGCERPVASLAHGIAW